MNVKGMRMFGAKRYMSKGKWFIDTFDAQGKPMECDEATKETLLTSGLLDGWPDDVASVMISWEFFPDGTDKAFNA